MFKNQIGNYCQNIIPPPMGKDVFICYSRKDNRFVKQLCKQLDIQGLSYCLSINGKSDIMPSKQVAAIRESKVFLFLASENSYQSPFAVKYLVYAFNSIDIKRIVVYQTDFVDLPENISFTCDKDNILLANGHYVTEELIKKISILISTAPVPFDEEVTSNLLSQPPKSLLAFIKFAYPAIGLLLVVGLGLWQKSFIFGGSVLIAVLFLWRLLMSYGRFMRERAPSGAPKRGTHKAIIGILSFLWGLSIPISTWFGLQVNSWARGLIIFGIAYTVYLALYGLFYLLDSFVTVEKAPLSNQSKSPHYLDYYLCYSPSDEDIIDRIKLELRRNGITYLTREDLSTEKAVELCRGFLYIGSRTTYDHEQCNQELMYGFNHRRPILAYIIDQTAMPEEKKLVFSNSNVRNLADHPIETTLMSDLKTILQSVQDHKDYQVDGSFWRTIWITLSIVISMVGAVLGAIWLHSIVLGIASPCFVLIIWDSLVNVQKRRKSITRQVSRERVWVECMLLLLASIIPFLCWWFLPAMSLWVEILLAMVLLIACTGLTISYESIANADPVGVLEPDQIQEYYDVFISYSRRDKEYADSVCNFLTKKGYSFFIDRQAIPGGSEFPTVLADAIRHCGLFLFLISKNSLSSNFCQRENQYAQNHKPMNDLCGLSLNAHSDHTAVVASINQEMINESVLFQEDWERNLLKLIQKRLPRSQQFLKHKAEKNGKSTYRQWLTYTIDTLKKNPLKAFILLVLAISSVIGLSFNSFTIGFGVYSFLAPMILIVRPSFETAFIQSLQFLTFGIWIGLISHSIWIGVLSGFAILVVASSIRIKI